MNQPTPFVCGKCCRMFGTVQALRAHFGAMHPAVPRPPHVVRKRRPKRITYMNTS